MAVTMFHSMRDPADDEAFARWYEGSGERYFLNQRSKHEAMLHRAPCPHYVFNGPVRLARKRKVCAEHVADLRAWASDAQVELVDCTDCRP